MEYVWENFLFFMCSISHPFPEKQLLLGNI